MPYVCQLDAASLSNGPCSTARMPQIQTRRTRTGRRHAARHHPLLQSAARQCSTGSARTHAGDEGIFDGQPDKIWRRKSTTTSRKIGDDADAASRPQDHDRGTAIDNGTVAGNRRSPRNGSAQVAAPDRHLRSRHTTRAQPASGRAKPAASTDTVMGGRTIDAAAGEELTSTGAPFMQPTVTHLDTGASASMLVSTSSSCRGRLGRGM